MKQNFFTLILLACLALQACSSDSSDSSGGSSSGSSTIDTSTASARINAAASSLLPAVNASDVSENVSAARAATRVAIDGTSGEWDTYLDSDNAYVLTDIFGSPDEDPALVTRVRVLLEQFSNDLNGLLATDPDIDCTGGSALSEGTTIDIAFFGEVDNGTVADPFYDCLNDSEDVTIIYGLDASGNLHVAQMSDTTSENAEEVPTRGDTQRIMQVVQVVYGEQSDGSSGFIDLQYAQASIYNGPDGLFDNDDDSLFKSRSRVSGEVAIDGDGNVSNGTGEFNVIKFDGGLNEGEEDPYTITTQTMGRGDYSAEGFSLFKINSEVDAVAAIPGTFCIQTPSSGLPAFAADSNCSSLEIAYSWASTSFPFDLVPAIEEVFADNDFYDDSDSADTGLIANDGSNFTIPSY